MTSVMIVCMGNICRSPAGEAMLQHLAEKQGVEELHVESCGIGEWHVGQLPDSRMRAAAKARGLILTSRAQQFNMAFFDSFDYLLAVDREILHCLYSYAETTEHKAKVHLMTEYSAVYGNEDIPDPYYLSNGAFEQVLEMLEDACIGLLDRMKP